MKQKFAFYRHENHSNLEIFFKPSKTLSKYIESGDAYVSEDFPPIDMEFIDAFTYDKNTNKFMCDEKVIQNAAKDILRTRRNEALENLDKEQIKYLGDQDKLKRIEVVKKKLRDLPETIDFTTVATPNDARHIVPPILETYLEDAT